MMVGLICANTVCLGAWVAFTVSRAQYAQSVVRRLSRWLDNIRIKAHFWIPPSHVASFQGGEIELQPGHRSFWQDVLLTDKRFGPVHFAVARPLGSDEYWYEISDEAAELKTWQDYGLRFDLEA